MILQKRQSCSLMFSFTLIKPTRRGQNLAKTREQSVSSGILKVTGPDGITFPTYIFSQSAPRWVLLHGALVGQRAHSWIERRLQLANWDLSPSTTETD